MAKQPEETGLIQKYLAPLAGPEGLGLADDAACLSPNPGMDLVVTTDTVVEGVHFLSANTPQQIAIKSITVNLSDLVAKGAHPLGWQIALSFPKKPEETWFADFCSGLRKMVSGKLTGGDMTVSRGGPLTITVTAIGEVPSGQMIRRDGAGISDDIYVCGPIGTSAVGLKCALDEAWAVKSGLEKQEIQELAERYAAPTVPHSSFFAGLIRSHATASLDISDGLAIDLGRLCASSGAGAVINLADLPFDDTVRRLIANGSVTMREVITGGDDYVALFTAPASSRKELEASGFPAGGRIGKIVEAEKGVTFLNEDGSALLLGERTGYDHFSE